MSFWLGVLVMIYKNSSAISPIPAAKIRPSYSHWFLSLIVTADLPDQLFATLRDECLSTDKEADLKCHIPNYAVMKRRIPGCFCTCIVVLRVCNPGPKWKSRKSGIFFEISRDPGNSRDLLKSILNNHLDRGTRGPSPYICKICDSRQI